MGESGPHIHYHASVGRSGHALTGCLREKATTYLIVEAVIQEYTDLSARREFDKRMQVHLPVLGTSENTIPEVTSEPEESSVEKEKMPHHEKPDEDDDLPGGLAEIIRDLTRRQSP
jgi:hypothetical protein